MKFVAVWILRGSVVPADTAQKAVEPLRVEGQQKATVSLDVRP